MSRIDVSLESLLALAELKCIRFHEGQMTIKRNQNGWRVELDENTVGLGNDLPTALENIILPPETRDTESHENPQK